MNSLRVCLSLILVIFMVGAQPVLAAKKGEEKSKAEEKKEETKEKKSIEEIIKNSQRIDGLFTLFRDKDNGNLRMLLRKDQLEIDFLYFTQVEDGIMSAGFSLARGAYNLQQAKLFRIERYFDRIDVVEQNTRFYYDPEKAISRSAGANISPAVVFTQKIEAENKKRGEILIEVHPLFLSEALFPLQPLPSPESKPHEAFSLGALSKNKNKIKNIRNYPENTDIIVEYVYENKKPHVSGGPEVTDPRFISIVARHSFIKAPQQPMTARFDDPRIGYFTHQVTDLSSVEINPYRDVISRFRLEKKQPAAPLSEPVSPITFWLENTTPQELRPIITQAALRWNDAFKAAGFKNAIQIKIQPDNADWDAGDIRYNVIRWVSSPQRFYSGYGPSFHDPRSGEVLGADIMLEYASLTQRHQLATVLGQPNDGASLPASPHRCDVAAQANQQYLFSLTALKAFGASDEQQQRLLKEFIYYLTLHEIGHTLGLNHNFRSTYLHSVEDLFKPEITYPVGLNASVMDYPAVPFQDDPNIKHQFFSTRPGPYDIWAIEFGYHPAMDNAEAEAKRQQALLARSSEHALGFGNDADDMRSPGKGIDPRVMVYAHSSDPVAFAKLQIDHIRTMQPKLRQKLQDEKDPYHFLLISHDLSLGQFRRHLNTVSRFIGGVYVERSESQSSKNTASLPPFTPVSAEDQRRAMATLSNELFAPQSFASFDINAGYLLQKRRGFNHYDNTIDPKLHLSALAIQQGVLDHVLHFSVLNRLIDSEKYGNQYSLEELFVSLTDAVFKADLKTAVNSYRQNLQVEYTQRLINILRNSAYPSLAQSMALNRLRWVEKSLKRHRGRELEVKAHRELILYRIEKALDI